MKQHEIMTIQEVAEYLRVSERTIYDWATKQMIPSGKLGTSWRFKRSEIETWVDKRLQSENKPIVPSQISLQNIFTKEQTILFDASTKMEALQHLIDAVTELPQINDREELTQKLFQREKLMSTGIGYGIGIPHARLKSMNNIVMAVGISSSDIVDYESLDGVPIRIIFMIIAGENQHALYIKTLAEISRKIKNPSFRNELLEAKDQSIAYNILTR